MHSLQKRSSILGPSFQMSTEKNEQQTLIVFATCRLAHLSPLERGFSVLLPPSQRLSNTPAPPHHSRSDRNNCDSSMRPRSRSCVRASAPEMKRSQSAQRTRSLSRTRSSSQHSPESEGVMSALRAADVSYKFMQQ